MSCFGDNDGSASFSNISGGSGNYSYLWSNGDTSSTVSNLTAGNYNFILTDNNSGCQVSNSFIISEPNPSVLTIQVLDSISCFGDNNGTLFANISGGIYPYSYEWTNDTNGDTLNTDTITNLISNFLLISSLQNSIVCFLLIEKTGSLKINIFILNFLFQYSSSFTIFLASLCLGFLPCWSGYTQYLKHE